MKSKQEIYQLLFNKDGSKKIGGWWKLSLYDCYQIISEYQHQEGIRGDLCEIGCYLGRSTIPYYNIISDEEELVVVDVFEGNEYGRTYQAFMRNMQGAFQDLSRLKVIKGSSMKLQPGDLGGPFRLFSIDGDHSVNATISDLRIGAATLAQGGLIFLDDFDNPKFGPSVSKAISKFLVESGYEVSFVHSQRIFLARGEYVVKHRDWMKQKEKRDFKQVSLFGCQVPLWPHDNTL